MLVAPGDTPLTILEKLNVEVNAIVRAEEITKQFVTVGLVPIGKGSLKELNAFVKFETVRWAKVIECRNAKHSRAEGNVDITAVIEIITPEVGEEANPFAINAVSRAYSAIFVIIISPGVD